MGNTVLTMPAWAAVLLALLALAPLVLLPLRLLKSLRGTSSDAPDWSVPTLDAYADRTSFFHSWDARYKIATLFAFSFLVVSLERLPWCLAAVAIAAAAVHFCRIPWKRAVGRLTAMAGFLSMFLVVMPFTTPDRPGETLILVPLLQQWPFHLHGFILALTIVLKACAVALLMEPMLGTAPLAVTLHALARLGLPGSVGQMILLTHRYIFVFLQEILRMHRSMRVRGFAPGTNLATIRAMGNFFGMLFVRSFERTQRVFDAMLSRGYRGSFPTHVRFAPSAKDLAKTGLWGMIGILLITLDRLAPALLP